MMASHSYTSNTPLQVFVRDQRDGMATICHVTSKWFATAHASDSIAADGIKLPISRDGSHRPIAPFLQADSRSECWKDHDCRNIIKESQRIYLEMDKLFLDHEVVYSTDLHASFCSFIERSSAGANLEESTSNYFAYLHSLGLAENVYVFSDRSEHGHYSNFINLEGKNITGKQIELRDGDDGRKSVSALKAAFDAVAAREVDHRALKYPKGGKGSKGRALAAVAAREVDHRALKYPKGGKGSKGRALAAVAAREVDHRALKYPKGGKGSKGRALAAVAAREVDHRALKYPKGGKGSKGRALAAVAAREVDHRALKYPKGGKGSKGRALAAVAAREVDHRALKYPKGGKGSKGRALAAVAAREVDHRALKYPKGGKDTKGRALVAVAARETD